MSKRKSSRKHGADQSQLVTIISYIVIVLVLLIAATGAGYYFGYSDGKREVTAHHAKERAATKKMILKLQEATRKKAVISTPELKKKLHTVLKHDKKKEAKLATHEYKALPPKGPKRPSKLTTELPKLAIIIDDVSFSRDVKLIKALNIPMTMSFLPPSKNHPDSAKLAAKEPFYMVHLPLEAKNFSASEPSTLYVAASQREILQRIREIKQQFPHVKYINNHTGSTFTSNEIAMNRLIFALRKENIGFIDSRTTAATKVPLVMKNFGMPYVARDVFLDHDPEVKEIKRQIKRAVAIANKHGSAIAIGHPHKKTLQAIAESKDVLSRVKLVRVDEL
ncbi:MAG: divergent polysaccharide deacetylase family protein [Campylobacterota bacterium]|nr:divergent polysaccharide deacetylase family protein [Campylobacterota bacterium]